MGVEAYLEAGVLSSACEVVGRENRREGLPRMSEHLKIPPYRNCHDGHEKMKLNGHEKMKMMKLKMKLIAEGGAEGEVGKTHRMRSDESPVTRGKS